MNKLSITSTTKKQQNNSLPLTLSSILHPSHPHSLPPTPPPPTTRPIFLAWLSDAVPPPSSPVPLSSYYASFIAHSLN